MNQQPIENSSKLNIASVQDLAKIMTSDLPKGKQFNWNERLKNAGFQPILQTIRYHSLQEEFFNITQAMRPLRDLASNYHHSYQGIHFINCELNIDFFRNSQFINCHFENCEITFPFKNCNLDTVTFNNCFLESSFDECTLKQVTMTNCQFNDFYFTNIDGEQIQLKQCKAQRSFFVNISGLTNQYHENEFAKDCFFSNTDWDEAYSNKYPNPYPIVVALFCPQQGISLFKKLLKFLMDRPLNIVLVSPEIGFKHAIFNNEELIAGYILPGGENIASDGYGTDDDIPPEEEKKISDNFSRRDFEEKIIKKSLKNEIPLLGVCRGHQITMQVSNAHIGNVNGHADDDTDVIVMKDTELHHYLTGKNERRLAKNKSLLPLTKQGYFYYTASCLHGQAGAFSFFAPKDNARISAISANDHVIEGFEVGKHIMTFQHHLENAESYDENSKIISKSLLKKFTLMVKAYHDKNNNKHKYTL